MERRVESVRTGDVVSELVRAWLHSSLRAVPRCCPAFACMCTLQRLELGHNCAPTARAEFRERIAVAFELEREPSVRLSTSAVLSRGQSQSENVALVR